MKKLIFYKCKTFERCTLVISKAFKNISSTIISITLILTVGAGCIKCLTGECNFPIWKNALKITEDYAYLTDLNKKT